MDRQGIMDLAWVLAFEYSLVRIVLHQGKIQRSIYRLAAQGLLRGINILPKVVDSAFILGLNIFSF